MSASQQLGLTLSDLLQGEASPAAETMEQEGDIALVAQNWVRALNAYECCEESNVRVDEKRGWCLGQSDAWAESLAVLAPHRSALSSAGLAMLAVASAGGWRASYRLTEMEKSLLDEMLGEALADEAPAFLAYVALFWFHHHRQDDKTLLAHARKALLLYPTSPYLRLQMTACAWRLGEDDIEIHDVLMAGLGEQSTTEYLWTCAESATRLKHRSDALAYLDRAITMTVVGDEHSQQAILQLRLTRAVTAALDEREQEAAAAYNELADLDLEQDGDIVRSARRGLLAMACRQGEAAQVQNALNSWLAVAIPALRQCSMTELLEGEYEPIHFFDGGVGTCTTGESLLPYRECLLNTAQGNDLGLVRFIFAEYEREMEAYNKQSFAEAMLQASMETDNPAIWGALAAAYAVKKRPDWRSAGYTWAQYEFKYLKDEPLQCLTGPMDGDNPPPTQAVEAYAIGIRQAFEKLAPSPHLSEIFASLRNVLIDKKMYQLFRSIADLVASGSDAQDVIFDSALGAHWCQDRGRAIALYWEVLGRNPAHYSALFNLMLLYRSPKDAAELERIAQLVDAFPEEEDERRNKLIAMLADAREACRDPDEVARIAIQAELRQYPPLISALQKAAKIPLQDAVTLITLTRLCDPADGDLVFQPFGGRSLVFSPTSEHRRGLFRLLQSGLVAVADDTPLNAFTIKEGRVRAYFFDRIWWRISPATISLVQAIEETAAKSVWPRAWCEMARALAASIAEEECMQYLMHVAQDRGWPIPDDDAKMHTLAKSLVRHVSVSEAFYLIYLGAMAASDYRLRFPVNDQQASNLIVLRASQKLERYQSDPWPLKQFSRTKDVPRSEISLVFYDAFLKVGERAFTERVDQLPYPRYRQSKARSSK